jgi:hypothetical protein
MPTASRGPPGVVAVGVVRGVPALLDVGEDPLPLGETLGDRSRGLEAGLAPAHPGGLALVRPGFPKASRSCWTAR